jgi:hypothetical protein
MGGVGVGYVCDACLCLCVRVQLGVRAPVWTCGGARICGGLCMYVCRHLCRTGRMT